MRTFLVALLGSSMVAAAAGAAPPARIVIPGTDLAPGDVAPAFSLPGSDGRTYRLQDFKGKQAVIVAWFAKANSAG